MGRPPLSLGTYGRIDFHRDTASGRVRARARFRDYDGQCRAVTRWAGSEVDARARLVKALEERTTFPAGEWGAGSRVSVVLPLWLADLDVGSLAPSTRQLYAAAARLYVQPALVDLRLGELTRLSSTVPSGKSGSASPASPFEPVQRRRPARRHYAQPVRDTLPIPYPRRQVRSLTIGEARDLQVRLRADPQACRLDLPDLVQFTLGTGVRIGEATAVRAAVLDLGAGTCTSTPLSCGSMEWAADPAAHEDPRVPPRPDPAAATDRCPAEQAPLRSPHRARRRGLPLPDRAAT